jgi:hypothetical protein
MEFLYEKYDLKYLLNIIIIIIFLFNIELQGGAAYSCTRILGTHAKTYVSLRKNLRI